MRHVCIADAHSERALDLCPQAPDGVLVLLIERGHDTVEFFGHIENLSRFA